MGRGCHRGWNSHKVLRCLLALMGAGDRERRCALIVRQFDGCARYLVVRTAPEGGKYGDTMLASGTELNVNAAMTAARRRASRIEPILAKRHSIMTPIEWPSERTSDGAAGASALHTSPRVRLKRNMRVCKGCV